MKHLRHFGVSSYSSRWYHIILWWELMRIPFNICLVPVGMASFYIAYVTIPLVYLIIGLLINLLFSLSWVLELTSKPMVKQIGRKKFRLYALLVQIALSVLIIFGFSVALILKVT